MSERSCLSTIGLWMAIAQRPKSLWRQLHHYHPFKLWPLIFLLPSHTNWCSALVIGQMLPPQCAKSQYIMHILALPCPLQRQRGNSKKWIVRGLIQQAQIELMLCESYEVTNRNWCGTSCFWFYKGFYILMAKISTPTSVEWNNLAFYSKDNGKQTGTGMDLR